VAPLRVEKASFAMKIASDLPHVGWKRAKAVVARFPTMEDMTVAAEDEWREVKGLGNVSAREIYKFIHRGE